VNQPISYSASKIMGTIAILHIWQVCNHDFICWRFYMLILVLLLLNSKFSHANLCLWT